MGADDHVGYLSWIATTSLVRYSNAGAAVGSMTNKRRMARRIMFRSWFGLTVVLFSVLFTVQTNSQVVTLPTQAQQAKGDLDAILKGRTIRVVVPFSKTQFYVLKGVKRGLSYESGSAFEAYINRKYTPKTKHLRTHVVFRAVPRDKLFLHLEDGTADIAIADLTMTPDRQKRVDFSDPMKSGINDIAVTGPHSPALASVDDLAGKDVYLRKSSSYWEHVERLNERFKQEKKGLVMLHPMPEDLEDEDLLEMVDDGLISTTIVDDYIARMWRKLLTKLQLHPEIAVNTDGPFGGAVRKNTPKLLAAINNFAKTHRQGTSFGNTIIRRYTTSAQTLKPATSSAGMQRFQQTEQTFRKYGDKYRIDYLLMIAKGFQESGLNQNAKSRVGAIGIMQVLPGTGAQMKVGDIRQLDPNIHAGVKYTRFLVDKYFAHESMDDLNKVLFAFGAYNAGPGRVRGLRKQAADQGLDPTSGPRT